MEIVCCWVYAISRYGYPPDIEQTCRAIREMAALGFKNIELEGVSIEGIDEDNVSEIDANKDEIKRLCNELGLRIVNFLPIIPNLVSLDKRKREKAQDLFTLSAEICAFFDCPLLSGDSHFPAVEFKSGTPYRQTIGSCDDIRVHIDATFDWERQWGIVVEAFDRSCATAREHGLSLAVEPRVGEMVSNTDSFLRLHSEVGADNFGLILDTGHLYAQKEILPLSVVKLKEKIYYVHVSDNDGKENRHLPLGEGSIDWPELFFSLKLIGYDGPIGIDIAESDDQDTAFLQAGRFLERLIKENSPS